MNLLDRIFQVKSFVRNYRKTLYEFNYQDVQSLIVSVTNSFQKNFSPAIVEIIFDLFYIYRLRTNRMNIFSCVILFIKNAVSQMLFCFNYRSFAILPIFLKFSFIED